MRTIVLISCVSKKKNYSTIAEDLYESALFKYSLKYAKMLNPDRIYILSALYGLVELDQILEPYNATINKMKNTEIRSWSKKVLRKMIDKGLDFENDSFVFLAGNKYREHLLKHIKNYSIPLLGLTIGKQLQFLKKEVDNEQSKMC